MRQIYMHGNAGVKLADKVFKKYNLEKIWADNTYRGNFVTHLKETHNCPVEIKSPKNKKGFKPIRKRWVIERTFA